MELELKNVALRAGDQLKVKGLILHDAERFQIDLGCSADDLALHFNPRFHDDIDGAVLVCNSKIAGCWGTEKRELHNPLHRGSEVKIALKLTGDLFEAGVQLLADLSACQWFEVKLTGDLFEVKLLDGQEVQFPNHDGMDVISYIRVMGDFKLTSFKIC